MTTGDRVITKDGVLKGKYLDRVAYKVRGQLVKALVLFEDDEKKLRAAEAAEVILESDYNARKESGLRISESSYPV